MAKRSPRSHPNKTIAGPSAVDAADAGNLETTGGRRNLISTFYKRCTDVWRLLQQRTCSGASAPLAGEKKLKLPPQIPETLTDTGDVFASQLPPAVKCSATPSHNCNWSFWKLFVLYPARVPYTIGIKSQLSRLYAKYTL
jgi:hypothetical protein